MSSAVSYLTSLDPPPTALVGHLDDTLPPDDNDENKVASHGGMHTIEPQQKKQVRLGETTTVVIHENDDDDDDDEQIPLENLWYTGPQIIGMRQTMGEFVRNIAEKHDDDLWIASLERLYGAICQHDAKSSNSDDDENDENQLFVHDKLQFGMPQQLIVERLGTEGGAVPSIGRDAAWRRKQLQQVVAEYQQAPISDDEIRQSLIRQGSRSVSRPSRLFARQVAAMAAAAQETK